MSEQLTQLQTLLVELHEVNQDYAEAARPLDWLSELNDERRRKLADQLRAQQARWESVTQRISQVLRTAGAPDVSGRDTTQADRNGN